MLIYLAFLASFGLNYFIMPKFIRLMVRHEKYDKPNQRKTHQLNIPTLGGIPVFAVLWLVAFSFLLMMGLLNNNHIILFIGTAIILIMGIYDDLNRVTIPRKLLIEIISLLLLMLFFDLKITIITDLFGTNEITLMLTIFWTTIIGLIIINAINFIDGIDTLCIGIVISILTPISIWFYSTGEISLAIIGSAIIGSLFAFGKYNCSPAKIFLGDSGSLFLGLVVTFMVLRFWTANSSVSENQFFSFPALTVLGILLVPFTDFISVIIERSIRGRSIFRPDRNHLHHKLLNSGFNHTKSANILLMINSVSIAFVIIFKDSSWIFQLIVLLVFAIAVRAIIFKYSAGRKYRIDFLKDKMA